ncbi:MAG: DUF2125 domain-containing protein [Caulobacteraceae bacterium]|nr:DUF2125 domain-containing protein [Caulobacteraceae bacterium]
MTHTSAVQGRKLSRTGLFGPFVLAALLFAGWSGAWVWLKGEAERRIDRAAALARSHGGQIAWSGRRIGGYPFRLDADFTDLRVADASGWTVSAPALEAEALAFMPTRWVAVATRGASFAWPTGGPINISASVLRASIDGLGEAPPRISVEGLGLTFTPAPGAKPFFLTSAQSLQFDTRAGPDEQGAVYLSLDRAAPRPDAMVGRIADGRPLDLQGDLTFSHAQALKGADWRSAVRNWSRAGGVFTVREITAQVGGTVLDAKAGALGIGEDGRLVGSLVGELREASRQPAGHGPRVTLAFRDGKMMLGGVELGPAPRLF